MTERFTAKKVLAQLHDFQRATVEHGFRRLYLDDDSTKRFLVADETGLGKTHVARGIIAKTIEYLQDNEAIKRIDVIYVCSNIDIADQNLRKLTVTGKHRATPATRLTMLVAQPDLLRPLSDDATKPVTFVSFTPATSFDFGWQTGKAEERAVLYLLLTEYWDLKGAQDTALRRILQGSVTKLDNFGVYIDSKKRDLAGEGDQLRWEPEIKKLFLSTLKRSKLSRQIEELIESVRGRSSLTAELQQTSRQITAELRQMLARCSVKALEPDLIILDEFQRFSDLLVTGEGCSEAAELANHLFDQDDARVLLLSATPYKPYTLAEEAEKGEDHYRDFFKTLNFLDAGNGGVEGIRGDLADFRRSILAGHRVDEIRSRLEGQLTKLLCRTERPLSETSGTGIRTICRSSAATAQDLAGYVALHKLAEAVEAPLTVEYWKSAPYFANFLDGYRVGDRIKDALHDEDKFPVLLPLLRSTQRIRRTDIQRYKKVDWGNARLRQLAEDTVDKGWWKLLWMPPSLPYYKSAGVFSQFDGQGITKRLIFSSWVAAPSAIASLLSYEAERSINKSAHRFENSREARRAFRPRLQYRLEEGRPTTMTTLLLFWPNPALANVTDPIDAARTAPNHVIDVGTLENWAEDRIQKYLGEDGNESGGSASTAWFWAMAIGFSTSADDRELLLNAADTDLMGPLVGDPRSPGDIEDADVSKGLSEHMKEARRILGLDSVKMSVERPKGLSTTMARIGIASPGNVAWRSLKRFAGPAVTPLGLWQAAATLATGFRSLFNRPESTLLLDSLYAADDGSYWEAVLSYCRDGNLQSVMDEYLHHLAEANGIETDTDEGIMTLADAGRRALTIRAARYVGADVDNPQREGIPFHSRFALRFGGIRQDQDDVRLPEVRAAFNSPFWPFVLASTSIGQEGVDFHWWCHAVVHWNLPSNPVDFEQREGRVSRYKGHAIRKNVAERYRATVLQEDPQDIWDRIFEIAVQERDDNVGDLNPYWIFPGPHKTERHILEFHLSRDGKQWEKLRDSLVLYKLAYGQPRQEDMVELLSRRGVVADDEDIGQYRIRLSPMQFDHFM
jgi:hypothetical protein